MQRLSRPARLLLLLSFPVVLLGTVAPGARADAEIDRPPVVVNRPGA
jgi:hypothetical protein